MKSVFLVYCVVCLVQDSTIGLVSHDCLMHVPNTDCIGRVSTVSYKYKERCAGRPTKLYVCEGLWWWTG